MSDTDPSHGDVAYAVNVSTTLAHDQNIVILTETNYTTDGPHEYVVSANGSELYREPFTLAGATLQHYLAETEDNLTYILTFDLTNQWTPGEPILEMGPPGNPLAKRQRASPSSHCIYGMRVVCCSQEEPTAGRKP